MAEVGDIIEFDDRRWVIGEFVPDGNGNRFARLVRKGNDEGMRYPGTTARTIYESKADQLRIEHPLFSPGQPVKVGDRKGEVIVDDDLPNVRVLLEEEEKWIKGDQYKLAIDAAEARPLRWMLVLENLL